jgi:hypothetical protein
MPKLCQIIAVTNGKKTATQKAVTYQHQLVQKAALLEGISRTYTPKDEEGERLPSESKRVQVNAMAALRDATRSWTDMWDAVATQDWANMSAKADVVVDGKTVLAGVPVTYLLFLEKQLADVHTFIDKLPTLDPAVEWTYDENAGAYKTPAIQQLRTKKIQKPVVLYDATKEHPAQVQLVTEDVVAGTWATVHFSGAVSGDKKKEMLAKITKLIEAVKMARELANQGDAAARSVGKEVFEYLIG